MKKKYFFLLAASCCCALVSGCMNPESDEPSEILSPQIQEEDFQSQQEELSVGGIQITSDFVKSLLEEDASALKRFVKEHPDFLLKCSIGTNNNASYQGEPVDFLLPVWTDVPEDELLNRERMNRFAENYKAGKEDHIAVISSGSPIPLQMLVMDYTGQGEKITISFVMPNKDFNKTITAVLEETDIQWIFHTDDGSDISYSRYGYEPIQIYKSDRELLPEEAKKAMEAFCQKWYSNSYTLQEEESDAQENSDDYYFFAVDTTHTAADGQNVMMHDSWVVKKDFSRIYSVEMVNGQRVLMVGFKTIPEQVN